MSHVGHLRICGCSFFKFMGNCAVSLHPAGALDQSFPRSAVYRYASPHFPLLLAHAVFYLLFPCSLFCCRLVCVVFASHFTTVQRRQTRIADSACTPPPLRPSTAHRIPCFVLLTTASTLAHTELGRRTPSLSLPMMESGADVVCTGKVPPPVAPASQTSSTAAAEESRSYQETERFCTWRKHVRNLYQHLFHIDLVWESPVAQLMPYVTTKNGLTTHTIVSGTRTGGQEQSYLQLLSATVPQDTHVLDGSDVAYSEATGEVGGYGMAPHACSLSIERRILHDGDVLAARYAPANPLLIASTSSNGDLYVFDWSRVPLSRFPNEPPRPRAPLPPNELSSNATEEERAQYQKRMRALNVVATEQDRWDRRTGEGQHVLTLKGSNGASENLDWSTDADGVVASGSTGRACVWRVANLSKDHSRQVEPFKVFSLEDEEARVTQVNFSWTSPDTFVAASSTGAVYFNDVRMQHTTEVFSIENAATCLALSPLDGNALLVGDAVGKVLFFDLRKSSKAVQVDCLHDGEVTTVQWCPHSRHLFSSGGHDGVVCIYNQTRHKTLFKHWGHTDVIMDLGWSWQEDGAGQLVSTDSNAIMLWRPRDFFYCA
ncbi:wd repeat protein [Leishmania tarentolae]|uniref:Wd repeat protein n=1 Tax=Leishmania tarentolae TaxID=5689 RepID=A0A640KMF9_LEITA|nr:wd repeat protein [Leishmania tarentolae]